MIGVPVAFALAAAALATLLYLGLPPIVLVQQIAAGAGSASLIAIPLFIFAGEIMLRGGISERLIGLASALVGHMRGGLGQVSVLSSLFFGGVSGSAIADVSAIGGTMIPQMVKRGFDRDFAVNVSITAALVALLVPPSHNLILYSAAAGGGMSIADLFAAGIVPALLMTAVLMLTGWLIARRRGYGVEPFPGFARGADAAGRGAARPGAGRADLRRHPRRHLHRGGERGDRGGVRAAGDRAAVPPAELARLPRHRAPHAARTTGVILFVIAAAAAFGWLLAYLQVPAAAVDALHVGRPRQDHGAAADRAGAAGARHLHGPGADDPDLHADLPAGGQGLSASIRSISAWS